MQYLISLTESAKGDIAHFEIHEQRIIVAGIISHLKEDAEVQTRKKKPLRTNPIAPWELRLDRYRVFYSVEPESNVKILAVAHKEHNQLFIRGRKVQL